jgi:parallel beta-helix repeat protein
LHDQNQYVILQGPGFHINHGILAGDAHHIRFKDLEITNPNGDQGILGCSDSCEWINLYVHEIATQACYVNGHFFAYGSGGYCHGIYTCGSNHLIEGNTFYRIQGAGLHFYKCGGSGVIIRNNIVHDVGHGLWVLYASDPLVYNNVIYNSRGSGLNSQSYGGRYYNNTSYGNNVGLEIGKSGGEYRNNILYNNHETNIADKGSNTLSNNLTTNPRFVNAAAGDFHLQAGSPAIDRGVTVSKVSTDCDKKPRPQGAGFDMGAYEYTGHTPSAPRRSSRINYK